MNSSYLSVEDFAPWVSDLSNSSILVTGASGLIGSNFIRRLTEIRIHFGIQIKIYASSKNGKLPSLVPQGVDLEVISGDLLDGEVMANLPEVDFILHGATYGQPEKFVAQGMQTLLLNTQITHEIMKKCRRRFLFLSTSEVYSGLDRGPFRESEIGTTTPLHPRAVYIEGKRAGETIALHNSLPSLTSNVARVALAYGPGPRLDDKRVLNELILRGLREGAVGLRGGGSQLRSYTYVDEATAYLLGILLTGNGEIYNVGGDNALSLEELAQRIASTLGVTFIPSPGVPSQSEFDAPEYVGLDMAKTTELVPGIRPVDLNYGLAHTVSWFRSILEVSPANP